MLKKYSLKILEKTINCALSLDETIKQKLAALDGKVLKIIIAPLEINFFIMFTTEKLILLTDYPHPPNTTIHSNPIGLIKLSLLPASNTRSLFNEKIKISGDIEFGQQVKTLFDQLDIDWEKHLAHFTGDVIAYQVGSLFRQGQEIKKKFSSSMQRNISEYLQEEIRIFPTKEEIYDFFNEIDELSHAVERLEARIKSMAKS